MTDNIGIVLPIILKNNQNCIKVLDSLNNLDKKKKVIIFNSYNNLAYSQYPILHINQCKFFKGNLFVYDTFGLILGISCHHIKKIYYYSSVLPWTVQNGYSYSFWRDMLDNDKVEIIAQNLQIYNYYNKIWKKPIDIQENFNIRQNYEKI